MSPHLRNAGLDAIRVLGIAAVVAGHVFDGDLVRSALYSWHVPLFFFLSGYLWKGDTTHRRSLRSEWRSRSRSLLVPYAAWLVLISAAFLPWSLRQGGAPIDALRPLLGGVYIGLPYSAFWFVTALVAATLLLRLLDRFPTWISWAVAVIGLGAAAAAPDAVASVPLSLGVAVPTLVFLLIGRAFRRLEPTLSRPALTSAVLLVVGVGAVCLGSDPLDLKTADFGIPLVGVLVAAILSAGLTLAGTVIGRHLGRRPAELATALAVCGIGVVLAHSAVIWLAGAAIDSRAVVFVLALTLPWALMLALQRTRLAPLLLGVTQKTAKAPRHAIGGRPIPLDDSPTPSEAEGLHS
jgi:acyltransferase